MNRNKEAITSYLVDHINRVEAKNGEIPLFSWGHSLRCMLHNEFSIYGDANRILVCEAYNRTHPNSPYTIRTVTLDNPSLTFENVKI